jgi:uncharacterized MnhB-related membrane protein
MTLTSPRFLLLCVAISLAGSILSAAFMLLDRAQVSIAEFAIGGAAPTKLFSSKIGNRSLI